LTIKDKASLHRNFDLKTLIVEDVSKFVTKSNRSIAQGSYWQEVCPCHQ
jgi:hypothetical protein